MSTNDPEWTWEATPSSTALPWFEDEDSRDLRRWVFAAAIVLAIHAAAVGGYVYLHGPELTGDLSSPIDVELAPSDDTVDEPEVAPMPELQQKQVEQQKDIEEPPPPPEPLGPVVAASEEPPPQPAEENKPPAPAVPAHIKGGAPRVEPSWQTALVRHLQQYKRYPTGAQSRGEQGVVELSFTVDRNGRVLDREIARSSGHRELDNEVMSMIERAQPLPPFPASMPQAKLDLTVPIRFSLR
jgi:periplasmic protein TonB